MDYEHAQNKELNELIARNFRDKYLNPPHYSEQLSHKLRDGLQKYVQRLSVGLEAELVEHCSGQYVQPLEYKGWKRYMIYPHAASKAIVLMQHIDREVVNDNGAKRIEYLFGTALHTQKTTVIIAIGISWRYGTQLRRAKRAAQNIKVDATTIGARLTAELLDYRLTRGLSAKISEEFSRNLSQPSPPLPTNFSSYAVKTLRYSATLAPEAILDHAFEAALQHVVQHNPEEYDQHLAVSCILAKKETPLHLDSSEQPSPSPLPPETTIHVARLWRSKAQLLQILQHIPLKTDSRQLEGILKERVTAFQGLEPTVWGPALAQQLHNMYTPGSDSGGRNSSRQKKTIDLPTDCVWLNHTAVTFHNWPVRSIVGFISTNSFWNTASHQSRPISVMRCAVSVLPCGGPTTVHLHEKFAQNPSEAPFIQAVGVATSLTVAMVIAWTWASDKYVSADSSSLSVPVPITSEDNYEEVRNQPQHIIVTPSIPAVQSVSTQKDKLRNILDSRMSVRHYNVEPRLITAETREMLWPTPILQRLLLSGELPASNFLVMSEYGVTHVVVTSSNIPCTFSSQLNYLKISENDDYLLQIQTFIAFIEALGRTDHVVLVAGRRGCNRSAGMVAALVMQHAGLTAREAIDHVAARRGIHLATFVKEVLLKLQQNPKTTPVPNEVK